MPCRAYWAWVMARFSASWNQWAPGHVLPTEKQRPRASPAQDSAGFTLAPILMGKESAFHPVGEKLVKERIVPVYSSALQLQARKRDPERGEVWFRAMMMVVMTT